MDFFLEGNGWRWWVQCWFLESLLGEERTRGGRGVLELTAWLGADCTNPGLRWWAADSTACPVLERTGAVATKVVWRGSRSSTPQWTSWDLVLDVKGKGKEGHLVSFLLSISRRLRESQEGLSPSHSGDSLFFFSFPFHILSPTLASPLPLSHPSG